MYFEAEFGNYELRYAAAGASQDVFERALPLVARQRCMGTARTPTPLSTRIEHKPAAIIAENGLRYVLVDHAGATLLFGGCTLFVNTQAGQAFLKSVFELENTIVFSAASAPSRPAHGRSGADDRIDGIWLSNRGGMAQLSHRFDGTRYFENEILMGTFSAQASELSIRYNSGQTVSCRYELKASGTQIWLTRCSGPDFPRVLFR